MLPVELGRQFGITPMTKASLVCARKVADERKHDGCASDMPQPILSRLMDDPKTLRTYAALFDAMLPTDETSAATRALRFMADEIERRRCAARSLMRVRPTTIGAALDAL
jgi:hypothetical protein